MDQYVYTNEDVKRILDSFVEDSSSTRWDMFFTDRSRPCPFFVEWPDENLVDWCSEGLIVPERVLELGAGHGRNAVYLARAGWSVDAVDFSAEAIAWGRERAAAAGVSVNFQQCSIFDAMLTDGSYDLVYDAGCFHHIAPHRRKDYVELVKRALRPGGHLGLVCFRPEGGSSLTDQQVYEHRSLRGGLGYSEQCLRELWDSGPFTLDVFRQMGKVERDKPLFGEDFLWAMLATKAGA